MVATGTKPWSVSRTPHARVHRFAAENVSVRTAGMCRTCRRRFRNFSSSTRAGLIFLTPSELEKRGKRHAEKRRVFEPELTIEGRVPAPDIIVCHSIGADVRAN